MIVKQAFVTRENPRETFSMIEKEGELHEELLSLNGIRYALPLTEIEPTTSSSGYYCLISVMVDLIPIDVL